MLGSGPPKPFLTDSNDESDSEKYVLSPEERRVRFYVFPSHVKSRSTYNLLKALAFFSLGISHYRVLNDQASWLMT
jgi:hypothetical protein